MRCTFDMTQTMLRVHRQDAIGVVAQPPDLCVNVGGFKLTLYTQSYWVSYLYVKICN